MVARAAVKIDFYSNQTTEEIIIPCHRHCDAFQILKDFGFKKGLHYKELAQGFLDEEGKFLTRVEAYSEAVLCGQLRPRAMTEYQILKEQEPDMALKQPLYSEDVW